MVSVTIITEESAEEGECMTKILWVSRHTLTKEQISDLQRIYGEISIDQFDATISDVSEITEQGYYDVYAVVLTAELISDLMKIIPQGTQVIQAVSERVATGNTLTNPATGEEEKEYEFRHVCWRRVIKAVFETERL